MFRYIISVYLIFATLILTAQIRVSTLEVGKEITALTNADDGELIYGTKIGEVGTYDGLITRPIFHVNGTVYTIRQTPEGTVVNTSIGLFSYNKSLVNISGDHLCVLSSAADQSLLITTKGFYSLRGNIYTVADEAGLPKLNSISTAKYLQSQDHQYILADGVAYRKDKWWETIRDSVIDISLSSKGIVILTGNEVFHENGDTLYRGDIDTSAHVIVSADDRIYLTNDNFISELIDGELKAIYTINTSIVTTIHEDKWQNIWVAAGKFLYRVKSDQYKHSPQIKIITINGQSPSTTVRLDEKTDDVTVVYKVVQLSSPQMLTYQSRLSPHTEWVTCDSDQVIFSSVPAGIYTYQLRSSVDGEHYTYTEPIKIEISDGSIFRLWMMLFILGLGILISALIGNYRLGKYKAKSKTERDKLLTKNKLLTLEQKALQLQMNPHFIFNALNSIKGLIAKGENKLARESLTDFAQLMRTTLDQSRSDMTTIADEVNYLERYLSLERWVNQETFDYTIIVEDNVREHREIPTMLVQPFVENAIKHGFRNFSGKGQITITFSKVKNYLTITIEDNGEGMQDISAKSDHKSVAMTVVNDRLKLKYKYSNQSPLTILSPLDDNGGTRVVLRLFVF